MTIPPDENQDERSDFFSCLAQVAWRHSFLVLFLSLLLAFFSLWYTAENLKFNTSRSDLISKDLPYNILQENYRAEFEDFDGMIVVVESISSEAMKAFAEDFVGQLKQHKDSFSKIFYKIDTSFFRQKALLYLDLDELATLKDNLVDNEDLMTDLAASPDLDTLLTKINQEISAGMVDHLVGGFIGEKDNKTPTENMDFLVALLEQTLVHLDGPGTYRSPWATFMSEKQLGLREEGYLVSDNENLLFILLNPNETEGDFAGSKDAIELIRGLIKKVSVSHAMVQVGLTGGDVISSDEMHTTQLDVKRASQIALFGVALLFILVYRGLVKPLLAVFALLIALAWSLGYTTFSVGHLNIISVVFTTILIGLGIDFGIHVLERFKEERSRGGEPRLSLFKTLKGTGRANLSGAITTAIAFGAMAFTDFIGIAELGVIAAGGVLLCFFSMVFTLPALVSIEERMRKTTYSSHSTSLLKENHIADFFQHEGKILMVSFALIAISLVALWRLEFDYNLLNLQAKGTEAVRYEMKIIENAKRATWHAAVISDDEKETERKYVAIKALPSVGSIEGLVSAVPKKQQEKISSLKELDDFLSQIEIESEDTSLSLRRLKRTVQKLRFKLQKKDDDSKKDSIALAKAKLDEISSKLESLSPETARGRLQTFSNLLFQDFREKMADLKEKAHPDPVTLEDMPPTLKQRFISKNGKHLLLVYPSINIWERVEMENFLSELRSIDPNVAGNAVHMFESSRLMIKGYIEGGIYALLAIILYLLLSLKNWISVILALIPTGVGSLWTVGLMDLFGVHFNMANLVILPLILGIGVVNGIHIIHRHREEPEGNVLAKSTGQAVVLSSLTTMIGFGSLMVADHQGVYSLGLVLTLGVGNCLIASLTLLPACIKKIKKAGFAI